MIYLYTCNYAQLGPKKGKILQEIQYFPFKNLPVGGIAVKKKYGIKPILASLLVTASLTTPAVVMNQRAVPEHDAQLIFEGARLEYKVVGGETTIQAIFDVSLDKVVNGTGVSFHLDYNPDYLTPSYIKDVKNDAGEIVHQANETVVTAGAVGKIDTDGFFAVDPGVLGAKDAQGNDISPFSTVADQGGYYSSVDQDTNTLHMTLELDQNEDGAIAKAFAEKEAETGTAADQVGRIQILEHATNDDKSPYVFNLWEDLLTWDECDQFYYDPPKPTEIEGYDTKVTLGQISFQLNMDRLPEIVRYFGEMTGANAAYRDYAAKTEKSPRVKVKDLSGNVTGETYLLDKRADTSDAWTVRTYGDGNVSNTHPHPHLYQMSVIAYGPEGNNKYKNVKEIYDFSFDKHAIIRVEATNPELTINAYQNFTDGTIDDLAISLGKYSPMVTVTYADGSKENVPFPWGGRTDYTTGVKNTYDYTIYNDDGTLYHGPYDATGDITYRFSQKYEYVDETGQTVLFPQPVTARMTVTPITVIKVTADDLERTYPLNQVSSLVSSVKDLDLPEQANIITDIVPSGVSLFVDLDGWKPVHGTWPDPGTDLESIKGVSFDSDKHEVTWPAPGAASLVAAERVGSYPFETSDKEHQTAQGVLSNVIREKYKWLTVPDQTTLSGTGRDEWLIDPAKRNIVGDSDYLDAQQYTVEYVSTITVTAPGNGYDQPTLTLAVKKNENALPEESVFRIWLPNGLEIGTGQDKGGVTVDDWFGYDTADTGDDCGFYEPQTAQTGAAQRYFNLNINPDEPNDKTKGKEHDNREILRRYINLGGWYRVAICEQPDAATPAWTQPIPVYVPPRRNEYRESKIYNFIAENAGLFNWPSGIYGALYLPQGTYTPVGPLDASLSDAQGVGLPLYEKNGMVSDGRNDPNSIFENGDPYRLQEQVSRYTESYGAKTIYDGQTGAQPGEIFTIKPQLKDSEKPWAYRADGTTNAWVGGNPIYKYGPTPLYTGPYNDAGDLLDEGLQVMAFGYVHQPQDDLSRYTVTLRRENEVPQPDPELREEIRLVSYSDTGITREVQNDKESNVTLVTYDTKMEGYTIRQDYTLIIKNVGDVDIYGLDIDGLTDQYAPEPEGGHFEMLQPPASFLPAGGETTFTLTYVYDLKGPANSSAAPLVYHDRFYITSTNHPRVENPGNEVKDRTDYLLDFDAEFTVSKSPLHKVTVVYKPGNGTMGTAGLIVGEQGSGDSVTMNYTTTTQTFPQDKFVYVVANLVDEYEIYSVVRDDVTGEVAPYAGTATLNDGTKVYVFQMPDHDVTVTVNFYEPIRSKLRLSNLIEFSAPTDAALDDYNVGNDLKTSETSPKPADHHTYEVWRKRFTDAERQAAQAWSDAITGKPRSELYLMTQGTPRSHAPGYPTGGWENNHLPIPADEGQQFLPSEDQYIVIIDADFDLSQVEATLRKVMYHEDYRGLGQSTDPTQPNYDPTNTHAAGYNEDIEVNVQMEVYPYGVEKNWNQTGYTPTMVYTPANTTPAQGFGPRPGKTKDPSVHTTRVFKEEEEPPITWALSPKPGESSYVCITLSAKDPEHGNETVSRNYYLEIHRKTALPDVTLQYGNSPYGMIMNEDRWEDNPGAQTAAKNAFVAAGYRFQAGEANRPITPDKVTEHALNRVTYWREAWVRNEGLFEPESFTGINDLSTPPWVDKTVYDPGENLDLDHFAYFAILGEDLREPGVLEARDSSGRPVDVNTISAKAEVVLLDTNATTQVGRFSGSQTATIELGVANGNHVLTFLDEHQTPTTPTATGDHWPVEQVTTTTSPGNGGEPVTTTSYKLIENIRPGRYLIQYTYLDFDGKTELNYYRPFVILRGVGDVNTDGVRNSGYKTPGTDEYAIEDRITDPLGYEAGKWDGTKETVYPHANVFKYRVCDVNNDRNINNIDANLTDRNARAEQQDGSDLWLRFYEPVDYGLPDITATPTP